MPQGSPLTPFQRGQIWSYFEAKWSYRRIAAKVGCTISTVCTTLKRKEGIRTKETRGRPKKLSPTIRRGLVRHSKQPGATARKLHSAFDLPVSIRTVQRALSEPEYMGYEKLSKGPSITPKNRKKRVKWALDWVWRTEEFWKKILFSDEKKFRLDGPDGCRSQWVDKRAKKPCIPRRQCGGGSIMVWMCFGYYGVSSPIEVESKVDAKAYVRMLNEHLQPEAHKCVSKGYIFMQDNAPCHSARVTKEWLKTENISVLPWPPNSPDCNPIENLWHIMQQDIYDERRVYHKLDDLRQAVHRAAKKIDKKVLHNLIASVPRRLQAVIDAKGHATKY